MEKSILALLEEEKKIVNRVNAAMSVLETVESNGMQEDINILDYANSFLYKAWLAYALTHKAQAEDDNRISYDAFSEFYDYLRDRLEEVRNEIARYILDMRGIIEDVQYDF